MVTETEKETKALEKELEITRQKVADLEKQLASHQARSEQFFDVIDDGIVILKHNEIVDCNTKTVELFRATAKKDIIGSTLFELSQPGKNGSIEFFDKIIDSVLNGTSQRFRWIAKRFDDTSIPLAVSLSRLESRGNSYFVLTARDITERLEYEANILKQKNTFQVFLNAIHESICLIDKDFTVLFINETMAERLNTTVDDVLYTNLKQWFPVEVHEKGIHYVNEVLATGKEVFFEDFRQGRNSLNLLYPIFDGDEVSQLALLSIDVTEKKEIESELKKLQQALESSPSTVVITNQEGIAEYVNSAFTATTGYTKAEILGKKANLVRSQMHDDQFFKQMWTTIKSGDFWRGEICNKKKNGDLFWELVSISPIMNLDGHITNFVAIKEDISDKKDLEQLKADIDRMMRHDLKTPLNSLIGIPQLLELEGGLSDGQKELVKAIEDAGRQMLHMIDLSLTLFQMESGAYDYRPKSIDLCKLLHKVIDDCRAKYSSKQLTIQTKNSCGSDNSDCFVLAERDLLYSVLSSFLITAIEASPVGEEINIDVTLKETKKVVFTNKGVVPEKIRDHFFGKYSIQKEEKRVGLDTYSAKLFTDTMGLQLAMDISDEDNVTAITLIFPEKTN